MKNIVININRRNIINDFLFLQETGEMPAVNDNRKKLLSFLNKSTGAMLEDSDAMLELNDLYRVI